jgi:hypothetical protein
VEIIRYQSKPDNELQILLNGVPMLPIGYPLSEISPDGEYMLIKQVFSLIDEHFTYGKSLLQLLKSAQGLEDEFWRLAFLKGQQSFLPPMINNTGRILSSKIFMPGTFTNNIPEGKLKAIIEQNQGITNGEIAVLKMLRDNIEEQSTAPQISGQQPEGDPTATEVNRLQAQAEKMLGLTVMSAALLEKKVAEISIPILLKNWFDPVDETIDKVKQGLIGVYRTLNVEKPVDGQGMGQEIVEVAPGSAMPRPYDVFMEEKRIKKETGIPARKIYLNRDHMIASKYLWRVSVIPQPKKTSNLQKLMFRDKAMVYAQSPNFSMDWFEENAAMVWGDNPQKVFKRQPQQTQAGGIAMPMGAKPPMDKTKLPMAEAGQV